jgi:transcriptional regulator with XRE-family HTH domain
MTAGNSLADNLARIRKSRDMSQQALAEAASVGVDTVARIEQGTRTSSRPATLRKLAAALGVSMGTLLGHMPGERNADLDIGPLRHAIILAADIPGLTDATARTSAGWRHP